MITTTTNKITKVKKELFSKKVFTFIICLSIASLLWVVHTLNLNYKYIIHIPVKFNNLPSNKIIIGDIPEKLDIEIKTSGLKLLFIIFSNRISELNIDFNSLKTNAKSQAYSISNGNFSIKNSINFNVEILKIRPDTLFFNLASNNTRLVPVKLNLKTTMRSGYAITSNPVVNPAFISVSGDSLSLSKIDTIYTMPITLKDVYQNYNESILLNNTNLNNHFNLKEVNIQFNVDRLTETTIRVPVNFITNQSYRHIKLLPPFVNVTYLVAMKDYDAINSNSFKATVNYKQIEEKQTKLKVELIRKPSEIKVLKIEPSNISYLKYN